MPAAPPVVPESIAHRRLGLAEHALYRERRQRCSVCLSCQEVGPATTACRDVAPNCRVDLIDGDCPRGKWRGLSGQADAVRRTSIDQAASSQCRDLFVYGFPGLYAGANTELHHQIILWRQMGIQVHLIPGGPYQNEPLYPEMMGRGVIIHEPNQFDAIFPGAPVMGFCNNEFLARIDEIRQYSHNTVFINCMTWLFDLEKRRHEEGKIAAFLYQNEEVRQKSSAQLRESNPNLDIQYLTFNPYFDARAFPFINRFGRGGREAERPFVIGRISRQDADKFSAATVRIWEAIDTPGGKRGVMLGFDQDSERKIGGLTKNFRRWVQTYRNQNELSQQDFYKQVDVIVQPMDTIENWPRIGLEAMASGCVLIVDNRGGWRKMVEHGVTGWLCETPEDFIHYATKMAYEPEQRKAMSLSARKYLTELAGSEVAVKSWESLFGILGK